MDQQITERARRVRMLIMDCDGVLTDGRLFYGGASFEGVFFNVYDGAGIKYLHRCGIRTAIITGRDIPAVRARAADLGIEDVLQGAKVKMEAYEELRRRAGLEDGQIAYTGDDLPDIPIMRRVGLAAAVPNAPPEVLAHAHVVTKARGGDGAVRELAELILKAQDKWTDILKRYLD